MLSMSFCAFCFYSTGFYTLEAIFRERVVGVFELEGVPPFVPFFRPVPFVYCLLIIFLLNQYLPLDM